MPVPSVTATKSPANLLRTTVLGSVLVWLAFPPVGWSWFVWIAPALWLRWIGTPELPGRHPYRILWLAGLAFWLLTLHWIRLPHPLNYLAWPALAAYLGIYLPVFIALARVGLHRLGLPLWLVAPVAWTGLDWLRGHLFTGFLMGSLAHTQAEHPQVIQIANLLGEYGVTFLIVLVAACLTQTVTNYRATDGWPWRSLFPLLPGAAALIAAMLYSHVQSLDLALCLKGASGPRLALIQGNTLADWKNDQDKQVRIMEEHLQLSFEATQQSRQRDQREVDLVIWPETAFRESYITIKAGLQLPDHISPSRLTAGANYLQSFVQELNCAVLVGIDHVHAHSATEESLIYDQYNAAVLVDRQGTLSETYGKMHRVVLGEYVPFAEWFPKLDNLTTITGAIDAGERPVAMQLDDVTYAVNICYETVVPHLIRRHVVELAGQGQTPDVLVNLTNDAWFWGSSELDMHLACGVFRAVEMRTPLVVAANGGLSAHIDPCGNVRQRTARQQTATLLVDLKLPTRSGTYPSFYAAYGDWFAILCVVCCVVLATVGWRRRQRAANDATQ